MVTEQYPHSIEISKVPEAYLDKATGVYWPSAPVTTHLRGRADPNGRGSTLKLIDGTLVVFDFIIFIPVSDFVPTAGDVIQIIDQKGMLLYKGTIARFNHGFFNMRIWV